MSYQFSLSFLMTFVFIGMTVILYARHQDKGTIVTTFNIFVASMALWCAGMAMFYYQTTPRLLIFWAKAQFFTGSLIASSAILFSLLYPHEKFKIPFLARLLIFLPNVIFYYLCFYTPWIVVDVAFFKGTVGWVRGPSAFLWHTYFAFAFTFAATRFYTSYKKTTGTIKERLRYLSIAFTVGMGLSSLPSVILPLIFHRYELYWMGAPLTFTWVVFIAYVIFKKPLMEIPKFFQTSILYCVLISFLALFQFFLYNEMKNVFVDLCRHYPLFPLISSLMIMLLVLFPLKRLIEAFIEKYIFSRNYFKIVQENEKLKEEMAENEKYKSLATLFGRIIFEIKNPLTTLKGYSYCLPDKVNDKEFIEEFSKILRSEVDRINDLVNHLTEYSKPSPLNAKETNIYEFLDETLLLLKNSFTIENINVIKKFTNENDMVLFFDPKQLKQALLNILVNAIDAMPDGGDLWVTAGKTLDHFRVNICDSGTGIPKENLGKVFEPFFTTKEHNSGLGLSVALGILGNHNGTIRVESELGIGTEIIIELPLKSSADIASDVIRIG